MEISDTIVTMVYHQMTVADNVTTFLRSVPVGIEFMAMEDNLWCASSYIFVLAENQHATSD